MCKNKNHKKLLNDITSWKYACAGALQVNSTISGRGVGREERVSQPFTCGIL